jgi:hypothetical protein
MGRRKKAIEKIKEPNRGTTYLVKATPMSKRSEIQHWLNNIARRIFGRR